MFYNCDLGNNTNGHIYTLPGDNVIHKENCEQLKGEWWDNISNKTFSVVHSNGKEIHVYALTKEQLEKNIILPDSQNDNKDEDKTKEGNEATSGQLVSGNNNIETKDETDKKTDTPDANISFDESPADNVTTFNIKNKKTYKKSKKVTIKDSDGIKSIKLNGKTIKVKAGKKSISFKLSKYKKHLKKKTKLNKLVITDVNGNKKTIQFKVK